MPVIVGKAYSRNNS